MKRIQVGLEEETLSRVDERRGLVARERFLRAAVEHYLDCDRLAVPTYPPLADGRGIPVPPRGPGGGSGRPKKIDRRPRAIRAEDPQRTDDVTRQEQPMACSGWEPVSGSDRSCRHCGRRKVEH